MSDKMTFGTADLSVIANALYAAAEKYRGYAQDLAETRLHERADPRMAAQFKQQAEDCERVRSAIARKTGIC